MSQKKFRLQIPVVYLSTIREEPINIGPIKIPDIIATKRPFRLLPKNTSAHPNGFNKIWDRRFVRYSEMSDLTSLRDELEIVKRELKNSANLVVKKRQKLLRQRTAYIVLFFVLWLVIYFYYGRGILR